ncbi:MAG: DegQ family serine endoprotease [Desulfohalobiaceae bacterium]
MTLTRRVVYLCFICIFFLVASACAGTQAKTENQLPSFSGLAQKAGSAVVNISTVKTVETSERLREFFSPFKDNPYFDEFFKKFFEDQPRQEKRNALGSGFIISDDGYIVTNHHVVAKADKVQVSLRESEETLDAEIVGSDEETDLALLKVDVDRELPSLEFGDSKTLEPGQWVVAIGNPFGLSHTVTAGIVSAKGRVIGAGPYDNFIQTDASINPGNSGGPLLNLQGEVVGINSAIVAQGQGIGFAIPSSMAEDIISQLKEYQTVKRGWLGVTIQDVDEDTAQALGLSEPRGALVASVKEGDPADKAGIQPGDVILEVNGQTIEGARDLTRIIGQMAPEEEARILLWREGEKKEVTVEVGRRDKQLAQDEQEQEPPEAGVQGMRLRQLRPEEARSLGMQSPRGLVITGIQQGSASHQAGLRSGDVILQANGRAVSEVQEFKAVLEQSREKGVVLLLINREGQNLFRALRMQ